MNGWEKTVFTVLLFILLAVLLIVIPFFGYQFAGILFRTNLPHSLSSQDFLQLVQIIIWPVVLVLAVWHIALSIVLYKIFNFIKPKQDSSPKINSGQETSATRQSETTQPNAGQAKDHVQNEEYTHLLNLWSNGVRDYHSLMSAYLTANSLLVAAIGLGFSQRATSQNELDMQLPVALCLAGIVVAFQMGLALRRFSAQNALWEWKLRDRENSIQQNGLFTELYQFAKKQTPLTAQSEQTKPRTFRPKWATRVQRHWWARRSAVLPWVFGGVYAFFLVHILLWPR